MFTGIIEEVGTVERLFKEGGNLHITVKSGLSPHLKVDQSVAHNGVCLTVVEVNPESFVVTAIDETLQRSNLADLQIGSLINLERCTKVGDRLDGHIVQGHVDQTARCENIEKLDGSWKFQFRFESAPAHVMVEKGSVTINGVSLTVVDVDEASFSVAIIPYTYEHTGFKTVKPGDQVNVEFDVVGKYVERLMTAR